MKKVSNLRRICHAASGIQPWYMGTIHARGSCTASFLGASSREPEPDFHHWFHYLCRFLFANPGRLRGSETSTSAVITSLPCIFGSIIATTVGVGLVTASASSEIAFAEHNNNQNNGSCNEDAKSSSTEKNVDIEKIVRQERERVEERLKKSDLQGGILPSFTVAAKGQQVAIRFQVPPSCDISHLIIDLISHLGLKTDESGGGSEMILRAWDRGAFFIGDAFVERVKMLMISKALLDVHTWSCYYLDLISFMAARAHQGVPLLYVPLEIVMSKYYGESERLLGSVFTLANELPNGAIIFLDEIDGFEQEKRVVVIAATNRRQDLDPALISMSGRDLRDICQQAERHWASKLIRGQVGDPSTHGLPPIQEYMECAQKRQETVLKWRDEEHSFMGDNQHIGSQIKKWPSVVV